MCLQIHLKKNDRTIEYQEIIEIFIDFLSSFASLCDEVKRH